jgi:hypothetical protein
MLLGAFVLYPKQVYETARNIVFEISNRMKPIDSYDNKYGIHQFLLEKVDLILEDAKSKANKSTSCK